MTVTIDDLTPTIEIIFKKLAASFIKVHPKGRVLYVVADSTITPDYKVQTFSPSDSTSSLSTQLKADLADIFDNGVKKVILFTTKTDVDDVTTAIKAQKYDWIFSNILADQSKIAQIAVDQKKFAVCYGVAKDSGYVVNFVTPSATLASDGTTVSGVALLPYAVGIIAGCPYTKSILYKEITKYSDVQLPVTPAEGTCFYKYDDDLETVKFANGLTSMVTVGADQTEDMKKITIQECMKRVDVDLKYAFKKSYQGKYKNTRVHQQLFFDAIKYGYYRELEKLGVLDPSYNNDVDTDVEEQRAVWLASGKSEAAEWDDEKVKDMTFGDMVIPLSDVKFSDAMESLKMTIKMA